MEYHYVKFNSDKEVTAFFEKLNKKSYSPLHWNTQDGLKIYGCICTESVGNCLFVYGKTILRNKIIAYSPNNTIFSGLKVYGSSKQYKGLLNFKGKEVLHNIFDDISIFFQTENTLFLKTIKNSLYGLICCRIYGDEVYEIIPPKYEDLFDAGEYSIGFVSDNKVGFMSLEGKIIVEAKYRQSEEYNYFIDGKALVRIDKKHTTDMYINHYGNFIEYPETDNTSSFSEQGTSTYPYGDLPDVSETYEDLPDAFWNTD